MNVRDAVREIEEGMCDIIMRCGGVKACARSSGCVCKRRSANTDAVQERSEGCGSSSMAEGLQCNGACAMECKLERCVMHARYSDAEQVRLVG